MNGTPTLVWVSSETETDDDFLWPEHNSIYQASLQNGEWSGAVLMNQVNHVITELTAGQENGRLVVACVADEDNAGATAEDRKLLLVTADEVRTAAEHACGVRFGQIPGTSEQRFIWNDDGILRDTAGNEVTLEGVTGEYDIRGNSVYYVVATESGAQLCVSRYENGAWSLPIVLTEGDGYLENVSVVQMDGNDYVLGLYTEITITSESVDDKKSLVWTSVSAVSDIRIDEVDYDANALTPGEETQVTLRIVNAGDHLVESVDVSLNGGAAAAQTVNLPVGQTASLTVTVTCPGALTEMSAVVTETGREDYRPDDNSATWKMGYADACVTLECRQFDNETRLVATVSNQGIDTASGKLFFVNLSGDVLCEKDFSSIRAGEVAIAAWSFDWNAWDGNSADIRAFFESNNEELYEYNNTDIIRLVYSGHRKITQVDMVLPAMLKSIEEEAFQGAKFRTVRLQDGVESIGARAFGNCTRLEQIEIPASVTMISEDAFEGVGGFVIYCPEGSAAEAYAEAHQITCLPD